MPPTEHTYFFATDRPTLLDLWSHAFVGEPAVDARLDERTDGGVGGQRLGERTTAHRRAGEGDGETEHTLEYSSREERAHDRSGSV